MKLIYHYSLKFCTIIITLCCNLPFLSAQKHFILSDIAVVGNKKTHKEVIIREMTIHLGDTIAFADTAAIWKRNQQNLYNLKLFNNVELHTQVEKIDSLCTICPIKLEIIVKERWYFFPLPKVVVEERNSYDLLQKLRNNAGVPLAQWQLPRLSYNLGLVWRNVSGRNDTWSLWAQTGFANRLQMEYTRPWLLPKQKMDFYAGMQYKEQKQLIYGTENGAAQWAHTQQKPLQTTYKIYAGARKRFTPFQSIYTQLTYSYILMSDSIFHFTPHYITNPQRLEHYPSWAWVYTNDKRDVKTFPLQGFHFRTYLRWAGYLPGSTTSFSKLGYSFAQYIPLSQRFFFAYGSQSMLTLGKKIPFYEKTAIWIDKDEFPTYYNDLRGYERYAIDGTFIFINKAEIKFALLPRKIRHSNLIPFKKFQDFPLGIYLGSFAEGGYVADRSINNQDTFLKNKLLYGYGMGIQIISFYDYLIRMEVARNHLGQIGFNFHAVVPIM